MKKQNSFQTFTYPLVSASVFTVSAKLKIELL